MSKIHRWFIEAEAYQAAEQLINENLLWKMFATDDILGSSKLEKQLVERMTQIAVHYQKRFNDDGTRFGVGIASGIIRRSDIIPQISNIATGVMGEYAREFIQKRHDLQKLNEELEQVTEKSEEGGYQAPKVNRYSDTSQYTETAAKTRTTHTVKKGDVLALKKHEIDYTLALYDQRDGTVDPVQYILMDPDINQNGNINDNAFGDGAIAATITTLDQGTEEVFKYGVGENSGIYRYYRYKMFIVTNTIDYALNLREQVVNCPACDARVNQIVAGVQTVVSNGLSGAAGAVAGGIGGPLGAIVGAVTISTVYSASDANKQVGELARPIAQYIVNKYDNFN